jgi:hypothetical protein
MDCESALGDCANNFNTLTAAGGVRGPVDQPGTQQRLLAKDRPLGMSVWTLNAGRH